MTDTNTYKERLLEEKTRLENDLQKVGRINPSNPRDWEATAGDLTPDRADRNEMADKIEAYEENSAVLKELEIRYNNILEALARIDEDTFGTCAVGGEAIEKERLDANPAATTCKKHINEEV